MEQVRHRTRIGHIAAVAGHRDPDLTGRTVAVVAQAFDEHCHTIGAVALVHDGLPVGATGFLAGAALAGALDVVVGHRGLLGLLDGVPQRRVAVRVTTAGTGRDLDVLDQLGEFLATARILDGLLMLGGSPLGMAAHRLPLIFPGFSVPPG